MEIRHALSVFLFVLVLQGVASPQVSLEILRTFHESPLLPSGGVVQTADGDFYGTTFSGGAYRLGTVYRLHQDPSDQWVKTVLHEFSGPDGGDPYAGLVQASDGHLYGTTRLLGAHGYGTVFRITTAGDLAVLRSFRYVDGAWPLGRLVQGRDGWLYGTTFTGGSGHGTIFRIATAGAFQTLHIFSGADGTWPIAGLVEGADGNFYGTTYIGGSLAHGTIFKISRAGAFVSLHRFEDGRPVAPLVQARDGNYYGSTYRGGALNLGSLFRMTPQGVVTQLFSFQAGDTASGPTSPLLEASDGDFYGTTLEGGLGGGGILFKLDRRGVVATLHHFETSEAARPLSGVIEGLDGALYGTTNADGEANFGGGMFYRYAPASGVVPLHRFQHNLVRPSTLMQTQDGLLYGTGTVGVAHAIFRMTGRGEIETVRVFDRREGALSPLLQGSSGDLYGSVGRRIFRMTADGDVTYLHDFPDQAGRVARLTQSSSGNFYGVVETGGPGLLGAVFRMTPLGIVTILHRFDGSDGDHPITPLLEIDDGTFIGTTASGGANDLGTVYRISASDFTSLHSFGGPDGAYPAGMLVRTGSGAVYGTTFRGGSDVVVGGLGTIFRLDMEGNLTTVHVFSGGADGALPIAGLFEGADGSLYGAANGFIIGGPPPSLFRMDPGGMLTTVLFFDDTTGRCLDLLQGVDGPFYGITSTGPRNSLGSIIRIVP